MLPQPVAVDHFRACMGRWASGVTVVTTADAGGRPHGFTASSFSAVSLHPPMVLVCIDLTANCLSAFQEAGWLAIHVLRREQEATARRFSRKDVDKFAGQPLVRGPGGIPLLPGTLARLECRTADRVPAGDHLILVAEVRRTVVGDGEPLIYYQRAYRRLGAEPPAEGAPAGPGPAETAAPAPTPTRTRSTP
ncbi:flavin reductase family protein [Allostreptomyces psammosilenae]|uniref:Flavin reductase ActVB n=1 Tax=Allostreptomyces psammosilenae TaxID=1892865 RepID=A0A852ZTU3_9ACTN|nr:flavin reductase family protein [Allostreptomyces psammosilenae]NYI04194.1 flavin reductase ActVB [Allostreptomyces psammosilenae]